MIEQIRWYWYDLKRLWSYWFPEPSLQDLVKIVGGFWLWRHGARMQHRLKLWNTGLGFYSLDLSIPKKKLCVEADGGVHLQAHVKARDVVRDQRMGERGWKILRDSAYEMRNHPRTVRRKVRKFLR